MRGSLVICVALMVFAVSAIAQQSGQQKPPEDKAPNKNFIYEWTSNDGIVHITDELGKVPKKYRNKAIQSEQPQKEGEEQGMEKRQAAPAPDQPDEKQTENNKKAEWRYRLKDARKRLADAEQHYRELDEKRTALLASAWSAPLPVAVRGEAARIAEEMKTVQQEIDDARRMIEDVIPEEARKNGIPPGWLREAQ